MLHFSALTGAGGLVGGSAHRHQPERKSSIQIPVIVRPAGLNERRQARYRRLNGGDSLVGRVLGQIGQEIRQQLFHDEAGPLPARRRFARASSLAKTQVTSGARKLEESLPSMLHLSNNRLVEQ